VRVLLIAYWFPPAGGIAVQRAISLAKYLPQFGCDVHVLAPSNPPSPVPDSSLLAQLPSQVQVHRVWAPMPSAKLRKGLWNLVSGGKTANKSPEVSKSAPQRNVKKGSALSGFVRQVLSPDPEVVWVPMATRRAKHIVRKHKIDAVIVTAPPFSAFLIGNAVKRSNPQVRLISDFRDEWLRFFLSTFDFQKSPFIRRKAERIERETIELSDAVVTVTPSLVKELRERYPDQPGAKFAYIPNGFDPSLFANLRPRKHEGSKIVVTYVGTVYSATSPRAYFGGLDALPAEFRNRFETRFVGRIADDLDFLKSRSDVKIVGYVSQNEALHWMEETDYLLLTMSDPTATTGKIYEYLATGKPIVAFSPADGEVAHTLNETKAGWCLDPTDLDAIRDRLTQIASDPAAAAQLQRDEHAIQGYNRVGLAKKFASLVSATSARPLRPLHHR
jgi:glycosyltransferase involved in cell wall biosynthesis